MDKCDWDYVKETTIYNPKEVLPGFYRIYDDNNKILLSFYIPQEKHADNIVETICDFINGLRVVESADRTLKESRKILNGLG